MATETIEKKQSISKYIGNKRYSKLEIKRHFTYPNKDPYEIYELSGKDIKSIRQVVKKITDSGIKKDIFDEEDSFSFESELAYMVLHKIIDLNLSKINLNSFVSSYYKFSIDNFMQAIKITSIAMIIINDGV